MAWNEPGNDNKDPWGNRNQNKGKKEGPPDLDEVLKSIFGKLFGEGGGGGGSNGGSGSSKGSVSLLIGLILVGIIGFYGFRGFGVVNEQEAAVVLRFGKYKETIGAGLRWNPPLIDLVYTENVTRVRTWSTTQTMLTKDLNIVDISLSVQYSIDDARDFVLNVRDPEMSLRQAASSALRHVVGSSAMDQVLTEGRSAIAVEVQTRLQAYLASYTTGIKIDKVNIEDTSPPKQVQAAFDDVIKAREDEERYQSEAEAYANGKIPEARGRAKRMIAESMAYKEEVIARAEGEAKRFSLLLGEYKKAPEVTRQRLYLDAMQEVLSNSSKVVVDVDGGNNMMYLPLDKMMSAESARTVSGVSSKSSGELDNLASLIVDKIRQEAEATSSSSRRGSR